MKAIALFIFIVLVGCKPQPIQHTIYRTDTIIERERLVPIKVEGSSVTAHLSDAQLDSLRTALQAFPRINRTVYMTDPKLQTRLGFALDSIGNLVVRCETLEKMYWQKLQEKDRIIERKEYLLQEQQKNFGQKLSSFFNNGILFVVLALAIFTGINWLINRKR